MRRSFDFGLGGFPGAPWRSGQDGYEFFRRWLVVVAPVRPGYVTRDVGLLIS